MKISIITINWNNAVGLEKTIKSVIEQTYPNIEYIVIDGGSKDNSVEIIKKYNDHISYWLSESDNGIYNAMNKGAAVATGEYCLFLNSGDKLIEREIIKKIIESNTFCKNIVSCDLLVCKDYKLIYKNAPKDDFTSIDFIIRNPIPHPSTFIKTELIKEYPYDEDLKIASDFVFFFKMLILKRVTYQRIPVALSFFYKDGISSKNGNIIGQREGYDCLVKYVDSQILDEFKGKNQPERLIILRTAMLLSRRTYKILLLTSKFLLKSQKLLARIKNCYYTKKYKGKY